MFEFVCKLIDTTFVYILVLIIDYKLICDQ